MRICFVIFAFAITAAFFWRGWEISSRQTLGGAGRLNLEHLNLLVREYKQEIGTNPPLDNKQFFEALSGKNRIHREYLFLDQWPRDSKGRVLDVWGMPYEIVSLKDEVVIRSVTLDHDPSIY